MWPHGAHRLRWVALSVGCLLGVGSSPALAVRVAMVKSWVGPEQLPVFAELNNFWHLYGSIRVEIDQSLRNATSFTYEDLVATGADVIWLSNPAGGQRAYSDAERDALLQYANEGHHLFGTYRVFRFSTFNNGKLAPLFGLPNVVYNGAQNLSEQDFELLDPLHPLFAGLPSPYVSTAFEFAQVPADGFVWEVNDLGNATLLAETDDARGVITLFQAANHHAIYISQFVEFVAAPHLAQDTKFIYNALTLDAAATGECCDRAGGCEVVTQEECGESGLWTQGGRCDPNPCPQLGACCEKGCFVAYEDECLFGRWTEGVNCEDDADEDGTVDGCDRCPGSDDREDSDEDSVPNGCDRCPRANDLLDEDEDGVPDGCDLCSGFDDAADGDGDGFPDGCDRCPGFDDAVDCDSDETPDGCDKPDCNDNGAPDNCDIADESSKDCDDNGVPDECQPDGDHDDIIDACDTCVGPDSRIGQPCDSPIDPDDCREGVLECSTGTLRCDDDDEADDIDSDGDGVFNCNDICPGTPPGVIILPNGCRPTGACCFAVGVCFDAVPIEDCDVIQGDFLGDGLTCTGDPDEDEAAGCADGCPHDSNKTEPGQCGCGRADTDTDGDETADCVDRCPEDAGKTDPGVCGCGVADADNDGDDVLNCLDGCPEDPSKTQPGVCGCGVADADADNDGALNCVDGCPFDPAKTQPGVCGCSAPDEDTDKDGALDCKDGCPSDPDKTDAGVCGCGEPDVDSDEDGALDCVDGCPLDPAKTQPGVCGCGVADADSDADGVLNCRDECPGTPTGSPVDENGCPLFGACCFEIGVCLNNATVANCELINGTYQGNGSVCGGACFFPGTGDHDADGDVDGDDAAEFSACLSGPGVAFGEDRCVVFDFDGDGDVDLADFAAFLGALSGP